MHGNEYTDRCSNSREIDHKRLMRDRVHELYIWDPETFGWGDGTYSDWLELVPTYAYDVRDEPWIYSNLDYVRDALSEFGGDVREESQTLYVRLYRDNDSTKGFTDAAMVGLGILDRLEDYPLLDEDAYSAREWEMLEQFASDDLDEMRERFPGVCDAHLLQAHIEASRHYGEYWVDIDGSVFHGYPADVWSAGYSGPEMVKGRCVECAQ